MLRSHYYKGKGLKLWFKNGFGLIRVNPRVERPIFDHLLQKLRPHFSNNVPNAHIQVVTCLMLNNSSDVKRTILETTPQAHDAIWCAHQKLLLINWLFRWLYRMYMYICNTVLLEWKVIHINIHQFKHVKVFSYSSPMLVVL